MKKGLLIDDKALFGWKSVLEKVIIRNSLDQLEYALDFKSALLKLQEKYDIIFLDTRLTENDHHVTDVTDYSGFKILKKIKCDFSNINFSTPIILLTASNKIWYINAFMEYGVDSFYIKEHPNYSRSAENSKINVSNFQKAYQNLLKEGVKRFEIWELSLQILNNLNSHKYFNEGEKRYYNVKKRIIDKLKLGYSYLFNKQSLLENIVLKSNNESLSFIIYFSILEEISKGYTDFNNTWDKDFKRSGYWKFRNKEYFIEKLEENFIINYDNITKTEKYKVSDSKYLDGIVNLSDQIYSLLYAYIKTTKERNILMKEYKEINSFRNKMDYIHSSVSNIFSKELIVEEDKSEFYDFNVRILTFLNEILKLK